MVTDNVRLYMGGTSVLHHKLLASFSLVELVEKHPLDWLQRPNLHLHVLSQPCHMKSYAPCGSAEVIFVLMTSFPPGPLVLSNIMMHGTLLDLDSETCCSHSSVFCNDLLGFSINLHVAFANISVA